MKSLEGLIRPGKQKQDVEPVVPLLPYVLTMRPHHFWDVDVSLALARRLSPSEIASRQVKRYLLLVRDSAYLSDIFGHNNEGLVSYQQGLTRYYSQLADLPNESSILFDVSADPMCQAATVGRHCTALNYRQPEGVTRVIESEASRQEAIIRKLGQHGYSEGIDYQRTGLTWHTFYDFRRAVLDQPTVPLPVNVAFRGLVARVGPLRQVNKPDPIANLVNKSFLFRNKNLLEFRSNK